MKKFFIFISLMVSSLLLPGPLAQQRTHHTRTEQVYFYTFSGFVEPIHCDFTYQYYYDSQDRPVKDGSYTISGNESDKYDVTYRYPRVSFKHGRIHKYVETGTFKDNYYDGTVKMNCSLIHTKNGTQVSSSQLNVVMKFDQGHPVGTWTFEDKRNGIYASSDASIEDNMVDIDDAIKQNSNHKLTATFSGRNIIRYECIGYSHDDCNITFDSAGLPSGTVGERLLVRGIMTNKVHHSNGYADATSEEKELIERYIKGEISEDGLIEHGYALDLDHLQEYRIYSSFIKERFYDWIHNDFVGEPDNHNYNVGYRNYFCYYMSESDLDSIYKRLSFSCIYIKKVPVASLEMLKKKIDSYQDNIYYRDDPNNEMKHYRDMENNLKNSKYIDGFYFTSNVREESLKYLYEKREQAIKIQRERNAQKLKENKEKTEKLIRETIKVTPIANAKKGDIINLTIDYDTINETDVKEVTCRFDKLNTSFWGYSTYEFTSKPYSNSIRNAYQKAKKVDNIWDTIKTKTENIYTFDTMLTGFMSGKQYKKDLKQYILFSEKNQFKNYIDANDAPKTRKSLDELYAVYSKYYLYVIKKKQYLACNAAFKNNDNKAMKDILSAYFRYDKENNVDLTEYPVIESALTAIDKKLIEQNNVQAFMSMIQTIMNNNEKIANSKDGNNIVKIYDKYFKEYDRGWAPGNEVLIRAAEVIAVQTKILNALGRADINELNKRVKSEKCKTMDCLLSMID